MRSTFKVLFYVKKGSAKPNGNLPLMCCITVRGSCNKILKDIIIQCGFKVRLTYHVARHCALSLSLKLNGLQRLAS